VRALGNARALQRLGWMLVLALLALTAACGGSGLDAHLERGEASLVKGDPAEARLEGLYVLQQESENTEALWLVGRSLLALNRDAEAEGYFRSLFSVDPAYRSSTGGLYAQMAAVDFEAARKRRAARRWELALEFDPQQDLGAHAFFVAGHFFKKEDYESAAQLYNAATEAYPDSSALTEVLFPHAESLARLGRWEEAREQLARFLKEAPKHPRRLEAIFLYQDVLIRLARADRELLDFESALGNLEKVLRYRINPGMIEDARLEKGLCLEDLGRYREAAEVYRIIVDKNSSGSGRSLEAALERLERIEKARLK
jgi:tetratricopeptide (TPR) repeat protein